MISPDPDKNGETEDVGRGGPIEAIFGWGVSIAFGVLLIFIPGKLAGWW